jgi:hypothetical protein
MLAPNLRLHLAEVRLGVESMSGDEVAVRNKQSIRPRDAQETQLNQPEGELTFCVEKLDAGAVCILHEWPNVSDECSRPI